ncbi:MAG: hypothetical protein RI566_09420 [Sediminimonas sp.]|uniref:hypothetical protein n=1 Tax=Sediminimonas sp. TaxID=2823379 RepID=UPI00286FF45A|nr:hypothetical protein [Sediminimonas sp.]MDR9485381.1 hypothetical protein [Sediminimonas sp.]
MKPVKAIALAALLAAPQFVSAEATTPMPLTYEVFEEAIPHIDLETCPSEIAGDDRFCRAVVHHDAINVFAFLYDADSPAVAYRSYPADGLNAILD